VSHLNETLIGEPARHEDSTLSSQSASGGECQRTKRWEKKHHSVCRGPLFSIRTWSQSSNPIL
jgi:hypothetical protein